MTGGAVEVEFADVRGEDLVVALAGEFLGDEVLEFLPDDNVVCEATPEWTNKLF